MRVQVSEQKLVSESQEKAGTLSSAKILGTNQGFQTQDQWKEIQLLIYLPFRKEVKSKQMRMMQASLVSCRETRERPLLHWLQPEVAMY